MTYKEIKLKTVGVLVFQIPFIINAISSVVEKQWKNLGLSLLGIVCLLIPLIIKHCANINNIELPSSFELVALGFIFLTQYLGELKKFYQIFWWWDLLLHGIFGGYAVIIGLQLVKGIIRNEKDVNNKRIIFITIVFGFNFSITLGTLWEMFEFIGDYFFKTGMVKGGLLDTSSDLLINVLAALLITVIYYRRFINKGVILLE